MMIRHGRRGGCAFYSSTEKAQNILKLMLQHIVHVHTVLYQEDHSNMHARDPGLVFSFFLIIRKIFFFLILLAV